MIFLPAFFGRRLEPGLSRKPTERGPRGAYTGPTQGLQGPTGAYRGLQGPTEAYRGLQGPTGAYRGLQRPTEAYRGLQKLEEKPERGEIGGKTNTMNLQPPQEGRRSPVRPGTVQGRPHRGRRHHGRHRHGRDHQPPRLRRSSPTIRRNKKYDYLFFTSFYVGY